MIFDAPDPAYTSSPRAQTNFRLALKLAVGFVALLWAIHTVGWMFGLELQRFGVRPRTLDGLVGIFLAPLLHGGFAHLFSNSVPLIVLGTGLLHLYPRSALRALPVLYLGPGLAVWLLGRASIHIGASGLVYGLVTFIFFSGILRRDRRAIAAALLVFFLYGSIVWGVFPIRPGMSWETHLAAALLGGVLAFMLRGLDIPPRKRYSWEDEDESTSPPPNPPT